MVNVDPYFVAWFAKGNCTFLNCVHLVANTVPYSIPLQLVESD